MTALPLPTRVNVPPGDNGSVWSDFLDNTAQFVFGSNLAGRHGKGAALTARDFYNAKRGVGEGPTGRSYAIPTKDANLKALSFDQVIRSIERFLHYASQNKSAYFQVTRIGCGLAGFADHQVAPHFKSRPSNVLLPGVWLELLGELDEPRLVVAGTRKLAEGRHSLKNRAFLLHNLNRLDAKVPNPLVVSGRAPGPDQWGEFWAEERALTCALFPARWDDPRLRYKAGPHRNAQMAWFATRLVALTDGVSHGTNGMIDLANEGQLKVWVLKPPSLREKPPEFNC